MTFSSSMNEVIVTISVSGRSALIRPIAVIPSMFGISRSISTTSGSSRRAIGDALAAVGGLADDFDVGLQVEEDAQARADDGVVVDDETRIGGVVGHGGLRELPAGRRREGGRASTSLQGRALPELGSRDRPTGGR